MYTVRTPYRPVSEWAWGERSPVQGKTSEAGGLENQQASQPVSQSVSHQLASQRKGSRDKWACQMRGAERSRAEPIRPKEIPG